MPVQIKQSWKEAEISIDTVNSDNSHATLYFLAEGAETEHDALTAAKASASIPGSIEGIPVKNFQIDKRLASQVWQIAVSYAISHDASETRISGRDRDFRFEAEAQPSHIVHAIVSKKYTHNGNVFPHGHPAGIHQGDGLDIISPAVRLSVTLEKSSITSLPDVCQTVGTVNSNSFHNFSPGEVLATGISGAYNPSTGKWRLTYTYAVRRNRENVTFDTITIPHIDGWDYVWTETGYTYEADPEPQVRRETFYVYVEQIYPRRNF